MSFKLKNGNSFSFRGLPITDPRITIITCPVERVRKECNCVLGLYKSAETLATAKENNLNDHLDICNVVLKNWIETTEQGEDIEHNDFDNYASDTAVAQDKDLANRLYAYITENITELRFSNGDIFIVDEWESDESV